MSRRRQEKQKYCLCRTTDATGNMVACDKCQEWFHFRCLGITVGPAEDEPYFCPKCLSKSKQCGNPECIREARDSSKYCSDECGEKFNEIRYMKFFRPKWESLRMNHSIARINKMSELERLESEKKDIIDLIGRLKNEKEELESVIKLIKDQAKRLSTESQPSKDQEESESEMDDEEEFISSDQSKTFCVICGLEQPADKAFKHWTMCHKKQEAYYNFSSDVRIAFPECPTDLNPHLYCQKEDKKTKRFCMNLESACPQHSNWQNDPDEICGCPLNVMQKLVLDGNYCTKLKKDCTLHYNWDRFRLASKDMERVQAFAKLDSILDRIFRVQKSLNDSYGGVVGVMLHNTVDESPDDNEMIDVQ